MMNMYVINVIHALTFSRSVEEESEVFTSLSCESLGSAVETNSERTSDEEPSPKVPHLTK